ncbi:Longin-like domain-containing protein [Flagelloscypha sp. PMI_526]|nr:Longin-like domain-containing protein [Flagelloscypha sp. PMI_526]
MITYILLVSRQGKVRLSKWFTTLPPKQKIKIVKDVTQLVLARRTKMCNFLEYKDDNELVTLEIIHRYVEVLDRYFGNVNPLHCPNIFNFQKAYAVCRSNEFLVWLMLILLKILDELIIAGEMQESSKKSVLRVVTQSDSVEEQENSEDTMARLGSRHGPMIK